MKHLGVRKIKEKNGQGALLYHNPEITTKLDSSFVMMAQPSEYRPSMNQRRRTVSSSSTSTQPPPYSVTDPSALSNASAASPAPPGTVRPIQKTTSEKEEAEDDYIPPVSGDDHPELIKGRRAWQGITTGELLTCSALFSRDANVAVQARINEYLQTVPPVKEQVIDREKMAAVAAKLYQAVGEGKAELHHFSAPSLFTDCSCGKKNECGEWFE